MSRTQPRSFLNWTKLDCDAKSDEGYLPIACLKRKTKSPKKLYNKGNELHVINLLFQMSNLLLRSCLRAPLFNGWSSPLSLPVVCPSPQMWLQASQSRGAKVKAGAGAAKGGKAGGKGGAMVKIQLEVVRFQSQSQICTFLLFSG